MDAGLFGARLGLDDAYRFARGEQVMASSGQPVKLGRPLDWLVIADHSDGMGFFSDMAAGNPDIIKYDQGKRWYDGLQAGGEASVAAALDPDSNPGSVVRTGGGRPGGPGVRRRC